MARSHVLVPSAGTIKLATNQYTDGANVKDDEVVVLGEQHLPSYLIAPSSIVTTTANSHLLQVHAGATFRVRIRLIQVYQQVAATAAVLMQLLLYRLTTVGTGGTATAVNTLDPADAAAGAYSSYLPGVKGTEAALIHAGSAYMMQTIAASAELREPIYAIDFDRPRTPPLILAAGVNNGIALKNVTAVAGGQVSIVVWLSESPY